MKETVASIFIIVGCLFVVIGLSHEDKYQIRDGCMYHITKDWNGIDTDQSTTLVTCDESEFHKYK